MSCESATQSLNNENIQPGHKDVQFAPVARVLFCGNSLLIPRKFPVYHGENSIGRDRSSHIFLPSLHLSRIHACIFFQSGFSFLSDCNSHNGTFRSTLRLTPHFRYELFDGTEFKLGDLAFIYYTDPFNSHPLNQLNPPKSGQTHSSLIFSSDDDNFIQSINCAPKLESDMSNKQDYLSPLLSGEIEVPILIGEDYVNSNAMNLLDSDKTLVNSSFLDVEKCIDCCETTQNITFSADFDLKGQLCNFQDKSVGCKAMALSKSVPFIYGTDSIELSFSKPADISCGHETNNTLNKFNRSQIDSQSLTSDYYLANFDNNTSSKPFVDGYDGELVNTSVYQCLDSKTTLNIKSSLSLSVESNLADDNAPLKRVGVYIDIDDTESENYLRNELILNSTLFKFDFNKIPSSFMVDYVSNMDDVLPVNFGSSQVAPVIIFTFILEEKYSKNIVRLGGEITTDVFKATHLITDKIRRTIKFLCCLARGCEILCADWLIKSKAAGKFLDTKPFRIQDKVSEIKYDFSLNDSCEKARTTKIFSSYLFFLTPNILPIHEEMKKIIHSSGGKILKCLRNHDIPFLLITCEKDLPAVYKTLGNPLPPNIKLLSSEFVLTGVLRQSVDFYTFSLFRDKDFNSSSTHYYSKRRKRC